EDLVGDTQLVDLGALDDLVLGERDLDDQLEGLLGADQVGQQVGAAPTGNQAQEGLGQGHGRHTGGDGPVGAVQRYLETAAHGRAVDQSERGNVQLAELAEDVVAQLADGHRLLVRL